MILTPIWATDEGIGKIVNAYITKSGIVWNFPYNSGLDSEYEPYIPLLDGQIIEVEYTISKGTMKDHAKYCAINNIGFEFIDGKAVFKIACQRKSLNVEKFF